ncbi:DUF262 domain-containing protein [Paenibacillus timonensis]|uniref:DUF262 domain-containing protein n=1 Tax=Paenibacillus timonensis TaxID=225915 RepID=UPI0022E6B5E4|nr:DUF262 domain-containing protein [Paenibacillus timonensis]
MSNNTLKDIESCNSLYSLLEQYEVRIPIIQRDYAQGRRTENANEVRKRLLDDIIHACKTNKQLDFNFVYGNRTDEIFYPVDGQQRLTTLYLFHWFLACRSGEDELLQFNKLNKFSYMTRNSASEFFALLKKPNKELCSIIQTIGNLNEKITDYAWFRAEWHNDPTVISALNMLNDMCNRVEFKNNEAAFYERLIDRDFPIIYFKVLLENGETAETAETAAAIRYIRMNARGKVLTTFENVKAMLDGIDEKLQEGPTKIIADYDNEFIDIFYNKASGEYTDMEKKTEAMDRQTMCFFRNMYNVAAIIHHKKQFDDDTNYSNEMYRYSQGHLTGNENFFSFYFNMMQAVLRVRKTEIETEKYIDAVFDESFNGPTHSVEFRRNVSYFLYLFHLYMKHLKTSEDRTDFSVSNVKIEKYDYVLKNLKYANWSDNSFSVINRLAQEVAEAADIFDYFESNSPDTIIEFLRYIDLPDIKQRIREQHIKARIIKYKKFRYDIFHELEERFENRKIQFLLWISGLWVDNVNFEENDNETKLIAMQKYMGIASCFFRDLSQGEDNLTWRKLFAIGGNWDEAGKKLLDSESINKNTNDNWENYFYWNDDKYFWDDSKTSDQDKLNIIKRTYDLISTFGVDGLIDQVRIQLNDTCWLKYAILKNHKELLTNRVSLSANRFLEISVNGSLRRFMPYVLLLDTGHQIEGNYPHYLNTTYRFSGFGMCQLKKSLGYKEITLRANKKYMHTNRSDISPHNDWRNYNITLEGTVYVKFINVPVNDNTIFLVDSDSYEVYQYQEETNDFLYFFYSLTDIRHDTEMMSKEIIDEFQKIETEISKENFNRVLEIKNGNDHFWKHAGGNTRSWIHKESLGYQLNRGNNYKILI